MRRFAQLRGLVLALVLLACSLGLALTVGTDSGGPDRAAAGDAREGTRADRSAAGKRKLIRVTGPELALAGERVKIRGRVRRNVGSRRVTLQRKRATKGWRNLDRARVRGRRHRFKARFRAPRRTRVFKLRVIAGPPRHPKARSKRLALPVTETEVLKPGKVIAAPAPGVAGQIVYDGRAKPKRGQFIALGVGKRTPYGWLGKVTGADRAQGRSTIAVEPVSLLEAIPAGHIEIKPRRPRAGAAGADGPAGPMTARGQFRDALECSAGVTGDAGGSAEVSLDPRVELDWGWFSLDSAEVTMAATGTLTAWAKISAAGQCSLEKRELFSRTFKSITVNLGPVPVVLTPQLLVFISAQASASAELSTSISGTVSATGGLSYDDGDLDPIGGFDHSFTYEEPAPVAQGSIGARVIPAANLLLYGVVGPQVELSAGPQLDVSSATSPDWSLTVPVDISALLVIPLVDEEYGPLTVYDTSITLAEGDFGPPVGHWSGSRGFDQPGDFGIFFDVNAPSRRRIEGFSGYVVGNDDDLMGCIRSWDSLFDPISVPVAPDGSFVFNRPEERVVVRGRFVTNRRVEGRFRVLPENACGVAQTWHRWFADYSD